MSSPKTSFVSGKLTVHVEGPAEETKRFLADHGMAERLSSAVVSLGNETHDANKLEVSELCLEHAWNWFALHADHRMRSIYFFLVSAAFLTAAFVTALRFSYPLAALGIALSGLLITGCFNRLELRIRELVKAGEQALRPLEEKLSVVASVPQLRIVDAVEDSKHCFAKYSVVVNTLHAVLALTFAAGIVLAAVTYSESRDKTGATEWRKEVKPVEERERSLKESNVRPPASKPNP